MDDLSCSHSTGPGINAGSSQLAAPAPPFACCSVWIDWQLHPTINAVGDGPHRGASPILSEPPSARSAIRAAAPRRPPRPAWPFELAENRRHVVLDRLRRHEQALADGRVAGERARRAKNVRLAPRGARPDGRACSSAVPVSAGSRRRAEGSGAPNRQPARRRARGTSSSASSIAGTSPSARASARS